MHTLVRLLQPIGAIIGLYAILALMWDNDNQFLIYLFPAALFLLGLSVLLDF